MCRLREPSDSQSPCAAPGTLYAATPRSFPKSPFLLFLAGLEIDLRHLRGDLLRLPLIGFAVTLAIGVTVGVGFHAAGWVTNPLFVAIALSATSLGLVVPVLKDAGQAERPLGQYVIAGATIADFGAVILLSLLFSEAEGGAASKLVTLGLFAGVIAAVGLTLARAGRSARVDATLVRLQDTTAEIRVRIAVALLIGFVALAAQVGLETILGAFLAGAVLGLVDRDTATHPNFRLKLDAVGYGFVIPVFFVTSGLRFDLDALTEEPSALARVPVFLLALLIVRGVPALLYRRPLGGQGVRIAALLQATSLPFIVTASEIGVSIGVIAPATAAGLISAGLLSVVLFPPLALARLRRLDPDPATVPNPVLTP
ncbi:MAG: cation:proton antiporter [Acidimicrobiia bacterium]|nr:cation:proton antiporter [Acidimicrobiia bacterium]